MVNKYLNLVKHSKNSRVFIVSMMVGLYVLAVFLLESYSSYKSEMRSAMVNSANLSEVLEQHISTSFKKIDLGLQELQDHFVIEQVHATKDSSYYKEQLLIHKKRLPEVLSFRVINIDGEFIGDDSGFPSNENLHSEYFQELKNSKKDELKISKPIIGKTTNAWEIILSRPIFSRDGKFEGTILATIPLEYYKKFFSSLDIGSKGAIAFYGFDHLLYARIPWSEEYIGKPVKLSSQVDDLIISNKNFMTYLFTSRIDGTERITTARKVGSYDFTVMVGLALKDFLYPWKLRTFVYIMLIIILFFGFAFFLLNFLESLELIEEQRKQAIQSAKLSSLGEMAGGIAHEINNPLAIISAIAMTVKRPKSEAEADRKLNDSLDKIIITVDRIAKIIKGIRSFARDTYNDSPVVVSIQEIVDSTLDLCHERLKNNKINLNILPFENQNIECREVQIVQVIMNLLNNSLDALEGSSDKWIQIKITDLEDKISIAISDSGKKIPEAIVKKMMQPFFTTKPVGKGTGLGLSISKGIIEAHNGRFYIDSAAIHTTFVIELPKKIT